MKPGTVDVACGLLFNNNRVLLTQRRDGRVLPFHWECPGGKRNPWETNSECLVREWDEELGITVLPAPEPFYVKRYTTPQSEYSVGLFLVQKVHANAAPMLRDAVGMGWFHLAEIPSPQAPTLLHALKEGALQDALKSWNMLKDLPAPTPGRRLGCADRPRLLCFFCMEYEMGMYDNSKGMLVTVDRREILAIIKTNREKHQKEHAAAVANRAVKRLKDLREALHAAESGESDDDGHELMWPVPPCYLDQYDRVIGMLELSKDDTIVIHQDAYDQFVRDKWSWSEHFRMSNAGYAISK